MKQRKTSLAVVVPALGRQRQADLPVRGQPALQSEFQDNRAVLKHQYKQQTKTNRTQTKKLTMSLGIRVNPKGKHTRRHQEGQRRAGQQGSCKRSDLGNVFKKMEPERGEGRREAWRDSVRSAVTRAAPYLPTPSSSSLRLL